MIAYNLFQVKAKKVNINFDTRTVTAIFLQTLFSAWMCYVSWTYFGFYPGSSKYSWHCEPVILELMHFSLLTFAWLPGWLFKFPRLLAYPFSGLVVLLLKVCRPIRHLFLCRQVQYYMTTVCFERCDTLSSAIKEEVQPCVSFARDPPQHSSMALLVGTKVRHFLYEDLTNSPLMSTDLLGVGKQHLVPS